MPCLGESNRSNVALRYSGDNKIKTRNHKVSGKTPTHESSRVSITNLSAYKNVQKIYVVYTLLHEQFPCMENMFTCS